MGVELANNDLLFLRIYHSKRHELLLKTVWDGGQHLIATVFRVVGLAFLAVKSIIDLTAELNLIGSMLFTVELCRVKRKIVTIVQSGVVVGVG